MNVPEPHTQSVRGSNSHRHKTSTGTMSCFSGWGIIFIAALLIATLFAAPQIAPITTQSAKTSTTPLPTTIDNEASECPKPTVAVLATGGTILGKGDSPTDTSHYVSGASHIDSIIDSIRQDFEGFADVVTHQILSTDSINIAICDVKQLLMLLNDKIALARRSYKQNNVFVPGDGSLLGRVVDFLPEIYHEPRESPKIFDIEGLKIDELPKVKYFHPMMEEEEFESAVMEGVKGAVLGVYDDGYWPDRLMPGLQKLIDQDDVVVAAVSYGYSFDVRKRIDGVAPAREWDALSLMMVMQILLPLLGPAEFVDFITEPYVKNERVFSAIECK
ncbi:l-asparaginase 2 [Fusarium beomiforme]|uniref:asparaginase n=1 Tax=Fusarium beomiforme TaxID=44412 RepID=A0A9P5AQR5_9HYPO|nr:l-asparaginase 2 [Fusarium beomiforme]